MLDFEKLKKLCKLIRYDILTSTASARSGHPTSSLSAVELMTTLFFATSNVAGAGFYHYDLDHPENPTNDRVIFSKGHASPLLYSLYHAAGAITYEELMTLRQINSALEGHPTPRFKYVDVATGSLGQGLSVGIGMALGIKLKFVTGDSKLVIENGKKKLENNSPISSNQFPKVFVLLGDSEMAEGQVWEAMQIASYYKLNNLIAIVDVNRLGQRGETMLGWDIQTYAKRAEAFGWETIVLDDGHDLHKVYDSFKVTIGGASDETLREADFRYEGKSLAEEKSHERQNLSQLKPKIIIAKTVKGKGVSFLEDKDGWHGKAVSKEQLDQALKELGEVDLNVRGKIAPPNFQFPSASWRTKFQSNPKSQIQKSERTSEVEEDPELVEGDGKTSEVKLGTTYKLGSLISTRQAYGEALVTLGEQDERVIVLDAELSNSTYSDKFKEKFPDRFFEMFIAEQNMISTAIGLEKMGYRVFTSTFGAFFTRAFDQIRMAQYSQVNLRMCGSHTGVFMGKDGPSQMGLEDFSMVRSVLSGTVLCGADAVSAYKLTHEMYSSIGITYLRTMRDKLPVIYSSNEEFKIGGSKILRQSPNDKAVVFAAGITVHEALKAYEELKKENISICVVDLYSIKPIDHATIQQLAMKIRNIIVVEDHYPHGGLGEAVLSALSSSENRKWLHRNSKLVIEDGKKKIEEKNQSQISNFHNQLPISNNQFLNIIHLSVNKLPRSGTPEELLHYEQIDAEAIIKIIKNLP